MKTNIKTISSLFMLLTMVVTQFASPIAVHAAGIVVNTLNDTISGDGLCSLREAIINANGDSDTTSGECGAGTGIDTITFSGAAASGTVTLLSSLPDITDTDKLTIDGGTDITIDGVGGHILNVASSASLELTNLVITNAQNSTTDGGALSIGTGATVIISNSTLSNNKAVSKFGGAINIGSGSTVNISNSTFSGNSADVSGLGGLALGGGAIQNRGGTVTITGSTFSGNSVKGDAGADGGAIHSDTGTLNITNSTFKGNLINDANSGSSGGAIRTTNTAVTITHTTLSTNDSGEAPSGAVSIIGGSATLVNNIIWGSTNNNGSGTGYDCATNISLTGDSGNLIGNNSSLPCGTPLLTSNPGLGTLQNNGGPTSTMAITSGVALNAVACASGVTTDQRGVSRPKGTNCEIGAYEFDPGPTVTIGSTAPNPTNTSPIPVTISFSESVFGFDVSDITVGNGTKGNFSGSGASYSVDITPSAQGAVTVDVAAGVAVNGVGTGNAVATQLSRTYDTVAPTATINIKPSDPTNNTSASFTFTTAGSPTLVECKLDGGSYSACTTGTSQSYAGPLAESSHTFSVRVTDAATNTSTSTYTWTIDTTVPTVTIDTKPSDPTNSTSASFTFTTAGSPTLVECKLGSYSACTTGTSQSYAGPLADGSHTFSVKVTDAATNNSTATFTWTVDTTAPTATIDTKPSDPTNSTSASFTFTTAGSPTLVECKLATLVECKLDGASYAACTTGTSQSYAGPLAESSHTFSIRVTDNVGNNSTSSYTWVVDTTAPTATIDTKPSDPTNSTSASFTFTTAGSPTLVECKLDGGSYAACTTGTSQSYAGPLADGSHTFSVRVTDAATNNSTSSYTWMVDATAPTATIDTKPSDPTNDNFADFTFTTAGSPTLIECKLDSGSYAACTTGTSQSYAGPLAQGSHTFTVRVTDAVTNSSTTSYTWAVDLLPVVSSITLADTSPTNATSVGFTVTFSENVTGVGAGAFTLTTTGIVTGASITDVSGSDNIYTVTVDTGTGNGTIRLDVVDDDSIEDLTGNKLGGTGTINGDFNSGDAYDIYKIFTDTFSSIGAEDGWVLESSETSNVGGSISTASQLLIVGDNAQDKQYKSFLSFDTSSLPTGADIQSVELKIKIKRFVGGNMFTPRKILKPMVVDISDPYFGAESDLLKTDFEADASLNSVGKLKSAPTVGWYTITLDSTAFEFVNVDGTTQLRLRFKMDDNDDMSADYLQIFSGDADVSKAPQLVIVYTAP